MIYLETNSLRTLANKLSDSNFAQNKYTSILTIIELLSGIKDNNEYQRRRGIINKIVESEIYNRIYPLFPTTIFYKAFGCYMNDEEDAHSIIDLLKIIATIPDYYDFITLISIHKEFEKYFRFTQDFDNTSSKHFISLIADKSKDTDTKKLIPVFEARWKEKDFNSILNISVNYYASKIPANLANGRTFDELVTSYDKSINPFLLASSYYVDQKNSFKNDVAKNDSIDLLHLLYIREGDTIVSDDALLNRILPIAYPQCIIKASAIK